MAHTALGCAGYSRTDIMLTDDGIVFIEINTLPGLSSASFIPQQLEAADTDFAEFIQLQANLAREKRDALGS